MDSVRKDFQPATDPLAPGLSTEATAARRQAIVAGRMGDVATANTLLAHTEPSVRAAALGSLEKLGALDPATTADALRDPHWSVRRRACELAGRQQLLTPDERPAQDCATGSPGAPGDPVIDALLVALRDEEPLVGEAAAWALGELVPSEAPERRSSAASALDDVVRHHGDPLCREAAVAALGSIGDPSSIDAVISALGDKPPIRRRATVALAAFDDPRVDAALSKCLSDRDWQVRQAAEDLLRPRA
jgi:HEAT repeat protein